MSYESKKSGFIVFNLLLFFHFYVHQEVIFCLFVSLSVGLFVCTQNIYRNINGQSLVKPEYSYARDQKINQLINQLRWLDIVITKTLLKNRELNTG
jgi:hypothetical protein